MALVDHAAVAQHAERLAVAARLQRRARRFVGSLVALLVLGGSTAIGFTDSAADPTWLVPPTPARTELTLVGTEPLRCADGWPSRSIGKQGACSHHGGVVGGNAIFETTTVPAVAGIPAPPATDWAKVRTHALWALAGLSLAAVLAWGLWLEPFLAAAGRRREAALTAASADPATTPTPPPKAAPKKRTGRRRQPPDDPDYPDGFLEVLAIPSHGPRRTR